MVPDQSQLVVSIPCLETSANGLLGVFDQCLAPSNSSEGNNTIDIKPEGCIRDKGLVAIVETHIAYQIGNGTVGLTPSENRLHLPFSRP